MSKTGGGVGTNQHQIKGVSVAKQNDKGFVSSGRNTLKTDNTNDLYKKQDLYNKGTPKEQCAIIRKELKPLEKKLNGIVDISVKKSNSIHKPRPQVNITVLDEKNYSFDIDQAINYADKNNNFAPQNAIKNQTHKIDKIYEQARNITDKFGYDKSDPMRDYFDDTRPSVFIGIKDNSPRMSLDDF
jgi:hypothetical protein